MTIILFVVDTSASMNQRAYLGWRPTLLDVAKSAVETFLKFRQRDPVSRGDRYMLLTFEEPPANIKAGWKENHATFMNELKNLQAIGMTSLGAALKNAFDVLNINRMQTGIDTYGQGRCPFYLEPSVIVVITDGGHLSTTMGVQDELILPMHPNIPGSELTREPFRWDQRLFSLVLRLSGTPTQDRETNSLVPPDNSPIDAMCEVTGGRSYAVTSQRMLIQCLESLVQKVQSGVVINFEKCGPDPPPLPSEIPGTKVADSTPQDVLNGDEPELKDDLLDEKLDLSNSKLPLLNQNGTISRPITPTTPVSNNTTWHSCRKLIYVQRSAQKGYSVGHWPIPEAFWPDVNCPALAPRSAHPVVKFTCANSDPMVIDNLPFDKYELEPSPLTQYILSRKQSNACWQVFVNNSYKNSELGNPFGYLKASTNLQCVNLFVMPYNYPILLPLLDELFKVHRLKPSREWRQQFEQYVKNIPMYYIGPLKRALQRMGAPNFVPDNLENYLSFSILNYLKKLKNQAKSDFEKLVASVGTSRPSCPDGIRVVPRCAIKKHFSLLSNPALAERFSCLKDQIGDYSGFMLGVKDKEVAPQSYRNPFDIPHSSLLDQIARMRANFLQTSLTHTRLQDEDQLHNMPVGQMGNYQEYLKRIPAPLRELESAPVRQHMFGNPFKIDKRMMVDEADNIDLIGGGTSPHRGLKRSSSESSLVGLTRGNKRKPGPLPRDVPIRRPQTPPPSTNMLPNLDTKATALMLGVKKLNSTNSPVLEGKVLQSVIDVGSTNAMDMDGSYADTNNILAVNHDRSTHVGGRTFPLENSHVMECNDVLMGQSLKRLPIITNHCQDVPNVPLENSRLKALMFKELRKPGRNFTQLFNHLGAVQGSLEVRVAMVRDIVTEAMRFKRRALVQLLEDFEQTMVSKSDNKQDKNHKMCVSPSR